MPARYAECFAEYVTMSPPKGGWTRAAAVKAVAEYVHQDTTKSKCGRDLIDWANGQLSSIQGTPQ